MWSGTGINVYHVMKYSGLNRMPQLLAFQTARIAGYSLIEREEVELLLRHTPRPRRHRDWYLQA